ncbi:YcaO-like family protein [Streptomyces sp. NPDC006333]|uniref:YcaO-like family protein n=1 Tax=Streptomyces sp. NPDC006333 TaxID=3156753 RepID=UPI0033A1DB6A
MQKIKLPGTHRAVPPETTWSRIEPRLERYGITRVADVTGLDNIGIPVMISVRPQSETFGTSQGKGGSALLAKVSAVMESIELWHAENPELNTFRSTAAALDLPYPLSSINPTAHGRPMDTFELEWAWGDSLISSARVPAPVDLFRLSFSGDYYWRPELFRATSNGLASGNTYTEACLHGLYEVIERDALSDLRRGGADDRITIDLESVEDPYITSLRRRLEEAGVAYSVMLVPNRLGVPTFAAHIWSPLFTAATAGTGSHMDPLVAMGRAITEAAQSRLTHITTTRDDLPSGYDVGRRTPRRPNFKPGGTPYSQQIAGYGDVYDDMETELRSVAHRVHEATGYEPFAVDLSTEPEIFSVVRVICPGLRYPEGGGNRVPR